MSIFDRKQGGFMDQANQWMTPDRAAALSAIGQGVSQMAAGRPVDLSNAHRALVQRQQRDRQQKALEASGLLEKFTPEERTLLATMPPAAAQNIIAQAMFPKPRPPIEVNGQLIDPTTMQVIGDFRTPQAPTPRPQVEAADGFRYYADGNKERVFPGVEAPAPAPTEAEQEIARMQAVGLSYEQAVKVKEGVLRLVTDPVTRETTLFDMQTQQVIPINGGPGPTVTPPPADQPTPMTFGNRFDGADTAFGVGGALRGGANTLMDTFALPQPFPETSSAQRDFAVMSENMTQSLAEAYAGRTPAFLLKNIQELTPKAGSVFEGPEAAQDKLQALGRSLQQELNTIDKGMRRRNRPNERAKLDARKAAVESALAQVSEALGGFGGGETNTTSSGIKWKVKQ